MYIFTKKLYMTIDSKKYEKKAKKKKMLLQKYYTSGFLPIASGRRCLLTTSLHMIWSTFLTNGPDCTLLCFLLNFWCQHFLSFRTLQLKPKFKFPRTIQKKSTQLCIDLTKCSKNNLIQTARGNVLINQNSPLVCFTKAK